MEKNSKAIIMLAHFVLEGVYCITRSLKMTRQYFSTSQRETWSLQWVNAQILIHSIFCTKRDLYRGNAIFEVLYSRLKKLLETAEYWSIKKHLISCWAELLSKNCCWQAGV